MKYFLSLISCVIAFCTVFVAVSGAAADEVYYAAVVPCSSLNIRAKPVKGSEIIGYLYCGDAVTVDRIKDGFAHCIGLSIESSDGWVSTDYLSMYAPEIFENHQKGRIVSNGRVALRDSVDGKKVRWLHDGDKIEISGICGAYTIVSDGYIMSEYVEAEE